MTHGNKSLINEAMCDLCHFLTLCCPLLNINRHRPHEAAVHLYRALHETIYRPGHVLLPHKRGISQVRGGFPLSHGLLPGLGHLVLLMLNLDEWSSLRK